MAKTFEDYKRELMDMYNMAKENPSGNRDVGNPNQENTGERPLLLLDTDTTPPHSDEYTGKGGLTVALTHSRQTYPVSGATVEILNGNGKTIDTEVTDQSGKTRRILLPAPSKVYSETPGESYKDVAAFYIIKINADGFLPVTIKNVPVFDGVNTTQPLDLTFSATAGSENPIVIDLSRVNTL